MTTIEKRKKLRQILDEYTIGEKITGGQEMVSILKNPKWTICTSPDFWITSTETT